MRLIFTRAVTLRIQLVPRIRSQNVMDILDLGISPDGRMNILPAQRLESIVHVRQRDPAPAEQRRQQALVGKVHARRVAVHVVDNLLEDLGAGVDDLQAAVHKAQRADGRVGALGLRAVRVRVLVREGAVRRDPVLGVVRLLERVADAGVAGGEDALAVGASLRRGGRGVELQLHQLVHVAQDQHV